MTATTHTIGPNPPSGGGTPLPHARPNVTLRRTLLAIGSVLLILLLAASGYRLALISSFEDHSGSYQVPEPFTTVDVRGASVEIDVTYAAVDTAVIDFDQGRSDLVLRHSVRGNELQVVVEPRSRGLFRTHDWGGELHITLPDSAGPLDLSVSSTAGTVALDGDFGAMRLRTTATDSTVRGSAESLNADTTAGSLTAHGLSVAGSVDVQAASGDVDFVLTDLPASIDVGVTAAGIRFEIPPGQYRIDAEATAGSVTQHVSSTPDADTVYRFRATAGTVELIERG